MRNVVVVVIGGFVLLVLIAKEVLDLAATIDFIEQRWPWLVKWAERRPWQRVLLLILTTMYSGILYEMWEQPHITLVVPSVDAKIKDVRIEELENELKAERSRRNPKGESEVDQEMQRTGMFALRVQISPEEPGRFTRHFLLITNKSVSPVRMVFGCRKATVYSAQPVPLPPGAMMGGSQSMGDDHNFAINISAPAWSPIQPLVIEATISSDDAVAAGCYVKSL